MSLAETAPLRNDGLRFDLHGSEREILDGADVFARKELYPLAARMDAEEWWPDGIFEKIGQAGYFGVTASPDDGGAGADLMTSGLVLQGFARWNHALALSWVAHENLCLNNILRNANQAQRQKYIPALCSGRSIGALGLTEPGAGSDALGSMRTTARRDGDHYVLNGTKIYITNGPVADVLLVYAKTAPELGAKGISAFIIEKDFPGFKVAQKLVKMGFRGSQTAELVFEDCRVPAENLVGRENGGVGIVMSGLDLERAMISPLCLGIAERALELSIEYAKTREQFGRPISEFQMIQAKIADMYVWVETMRTFTYRCLAAVNDLEVGGGGRGTVHALTAASVMYAAETMARVLSEAVQIHGGSGYIWESEINRLYRSSKLLEIGAGTTEVRKIIIAGELPEMTALPFDTSDTDLADRATGLASDLLKDKVVLVSGGGSGIGRATAWLAARLGARVIVSGRKLEKLDAVSAAIGAHGWSCAGLAVDIRQRETVERLFDQIADSHGGIDILVNSAGGQFPQAAIDYSPKGWRAVIETNLDGTFHMMQCAAQRWRSRGRGGSIVNVVVSPRGLHHVAHTCAARAGVMAFSDAVAVEWAPLGIRVNCVAPGAIRSEGWKVYPEEVTRRYHNTNPMRQVGEPWDIAEACLYLAGPSGRFITGETLEVTGGSHLWGETWTTDKPDHFVQASRTFDPGA